MAKAPITLPIKKFSKGNLFKEEGFEDLLLLPNSVDVSTVLESQSHIWDRTPEAGVQMTCTRCSYSVRVKDEDADLEFIDLIAPCDQVIVESVMDV